MRLTKDQRALQDQVHAIDQRIAEHKLRIASIQAAIDEGHMLRHQLTNAITELKARRNAKNT